MAWTLNCPHCSRLLSVPEELAGREFPCPLCGLGIALPAPVAPSAALPPPVPAAPPAPAAPPSPSAFEFDGTVPPTDPLLGGERLAERVKRLTPPWRSVRLGLALARVAAWGLILVTAAYVVALLGMPVSGEGYSFLDRDTLRLTAASAQASLVLLHVVGQFMCGALPPGMARRTAWLSGGLAAGFLVAVVVGLFLPPWDALYPVLVALMLVALATFYWQMCLRELAVVLRDRRLAERVENFTWWIWIGFGCLLMREAMPWREGGCGVPFMTAGFFLSIAAYARLVSMALVAVGTRAPTAEGE